MAFNSKSLANRYEILCQMIELSHQSSDKNLIIYTYHYASQYYRYIHRFKEASEFLQKALDLCGVDHPLKLQLKQEYDALTSSPNSITLTYWIFSKMGALLFYHGDEFSPKVDSDLFGMFFTALRQFSSECAGLNGDSEIQSIQWSNGSEFLIYHRSDDPIFIVGICQNHAQSMATYSELRKIYLRFFYTFEYELFQFQGNVSVFESFTDYSNFF